MTFRRDEIVQELRGARALLEVRREQGHPPHLLATLILFGARELLRRRRRHRTAHLGLSISPIEKRRSPMDPVTVDGSKQDVLCQCSPSDASGKPTSPTITWSSSDETVVKLEVAADTRSARGVTLADGTAIIKASVGSLADGIPVVHEEGTVVVSGIGAPPPPPPPTAALGLTISPVDKVPA